MHRVLRSLDMYGWASLAYLAVGAASALVEWGIFFLTYSGAGLMAAAILAFIIATFANYVLSQAFVFVSSGNPLRECALVYLVSFFAFTFNFLCLYVLHSQLGVGVMVAKILGTMVGFVLNFAFRQFLVFGRASRFASVSSFFGEVSSTFGDG